MELSSPILRWLEDNHAGCITDQSAMVVWLRYCAEFAQTGLSRNLGLRQKRFMALLEKVRVLDLTNVLAGPFCCYQLVQLAAEVIKVEAPKTGELARRLGADAERNRNLMGASFLAQIAGKRSPTLNLKHDEGKKYFIGW